MSYDDSYLSSVRRRRLLEVLQTYDLLSDREREVVLEFIEHGGDQEAVSAALHISPHTLRTHFSTIFIKLKVNGRAELLAMIIRDIATLDLRSNE